MRSVIVTVFCLVVTKEASARSVDNQYLEYVDKYKTKYLAAEAKEYVGGQLILNKKEEKVNDILMALKVEELDYGFENPKYFNFSKHYFLYKNDIENSKVYQVIKKMPKGGALHIHSSMMLHSDDLVLLTYEDHLFACYTDKTLDLQFSQTAPDRPCNATWTLLSDLRLASGNVQEFDAKIKQFFTLYTEDDSFLDQDINYTWKQFEKIHTIIQKLISYRPAKEKFLYMALKRFYDDNVFYIEIRSDLHCLYELDGTRHNKMYTAKLIQRVTQKFIEDFPDFIGVKLIYTKDRSAEPESVQKTLRSVEQLKQEMPDFVVGFDLVGQEDVGNPLDDYVAVLSEAKDLDFFFHAGETNWLGTKADENLFDAVALGTKRIGHAYALTKHPSLLAKIQKKKIALEVNVISNVVLSLIQDVRNHPLASFLAMGLPVVISSDDPGVWDADPLSHDFYVTFVGVASKKADLTLLKRLALNSIKYSALKREEKEHAYEIFEKRWHDFLCEIIKAHPTP